MCYKSDGQEIFNKKIETIKTDDPHLDPSRSQLQNSIIDFRAILGLLHFISELTY